MIKSNNFLSDIKIIPLLFENQKIVTVGTKRGSTNGSDHLTLAEVYAALTYYHANTAEVEADIAQQTAEAKRLSGIKPAALHCRISVSQPRGQPGPPIRG